MCVRPAPEWPGKLHIGKFATGDVAAVLEDPEHAKRPRADAEHSASAVFDIGWAFDKFDRLPRWREALERARRFVEREDAFGGRFNP